MSIRKQKEEKIMASMIRMMVIVMVTLFWLLFIPGSSFAQMYGWIDEKGTINVSDDPWKREFAGMVEKDGLKVLLSSAGIKSWAHFELPPIKKKIVRLQWREQEQEPLPVSYADVEDNQQRQIAVLILQQLKKQRTRSAPVVPAPPSILIPTRDGAVDSRTGDFFPAVRGPGINPRTGEIVNNAVKGYIDPRTGSFTPKW